MKAATRRLGGGMTAKLSPMGHLLLPGLELDMEQTVKLARFLSSERMDRKTWNPPPATVASVIEAEVKP